MRQIETRPVHLHCFNMFAVNRVFVVKLIFLCVPRQHHNQKKNDHNLMKIHNETIFKTFKVNQVFPVTKRQK